jgi:transposase-like protein
MSSSQEMQEIFARWKESGLSLRAFGRQEEISYSKLSYWRRKLREAEKSEEAGSGSSGWMPVRVIPHSISQRSGADGFEVRLVNGLGLRVLPGFDEVELRRLVLLLAAC